MLYRPRQAAYGQVGFPTGGRTLEPKVLSRLWETRANVTRASLWGGGTRGYRNFWVQNPSCLGRPHLLNQASWILPWSVGSFSKFCVCSPPHPLLLFQSQLHLPDASANKVLYEPCECLSFSTAALSTGPCLASTQHDALNRGWVLLAFIDGRKEERKEGRGRGRKAGRRGPI